MSAPSMPRPLAGLAAAALAAGLLGAPVLAYADSTSSPTPGVSDAATPSSTPTSVEQPAAATPEATDSQPTSQPTALESPTTASSTPEPSEEQASPSREPETMVAQARSDAVGAPAEPGTAAAQEQVAAQVEGPSISLTKSASPTRVSKVGQVVTYRFVATNSGSVPLSNVTITDELEGLSALTCDGAEPLPPGQALNCSATLTVTQAVLDFGDLFNFASVFGDPPGGDAEGANADARVTVDQNPSIALTASVSPTGTADKGDRLRYTATATNTGNVTLTAARITSSLDALDLDCDPSARATLAPGASIRCTGSYRVSAADARRGRVGNELTARAEPPYGNTESRGDDITDDTRLRVAVHKIADPGLADAGATDGTLPVGLLGVGALVAGAALLRRGLRS
jgi:uncharacterized repeat protein (TIGR01451 family)